MSNYRCLDLNPTAFKSKNRVIPMVTVLCDSWGLEEIVTEQIGGWCCLDNFLYIYRTCIYHWNVFVWLYAMFSCQKLRSKSTITSLFSSPPHTQKKKQNYTSTVMEGHHTGRCCHLVVANSHNLEVVGVEKNEVKGGAGVKVSTAGLVREDLCTWQRITGEILQNAGSHWTRTRASKSGTPKVGRYKLEACAFCPCVVKSKSLWIRSC